LGGKILSTANALLLLTAMWDVPSGVHPYQIMDANKREDLHKQWDAIRALHNDLCHKRCRFGRNPKPTHSVSGQVSWYEEVLEHCTNLLLGTPETPPYQAPRRWDWFA
jgi:hypothetical protein